MILFNNKKDVSINIQSNAALAVKFAAKDLQRDLRLISNRDHGFDFTENGGGIVISTMYSGVPESYTVKVTEENVTIIGADILGTVYGIYAFSTKILGFNPTYRFTDLMPLIKDELEIETQTITSSERKVRFRGWFINDEDLLTDFKISGGKRDISYRFYHNVMDVSVLDMVLETALRMEINLIIPSSFIDIDNPDEEKLISAAVNRGLYVSQHHVEPMGVSYFTAENYFKKRGISDEKISFFSNRSRMEEMWRYYAEKWAYYGENIVWQFGLRGRADEAVWKADESIPMTYEARGAIIADAIATQYSIVKEVLGNENFNSSTTLWLEGARLYGKGCLKVPDNTVVVFSDIGFSQLFGDDFYSIKRKKEQKYGVYYHVGYWGEGPHLAEGCDLRKMTFCYGEAYNNDSLYYSILNVSNVRPLHFSSWYNSILLNDPKNTDVDKTVLNMLESIYGKKTAPMIKGFTDEYYDAFADFGKDESVWRCGRYDFYYHDYGKLDFPEFPSTDGLLRCIGIRLMRKDEYTVSLKNLIKILNLSYQRFKSLYEKLCRAEKDIPKQCINYFNCFLKFETFYMMHLTGWLLNLLPDSKKDKVMNAISDLEEILKARKILEQGKWQGWHSGELKLDYIGALNMTKAFLEEIDE